MTSIELFVAKALTRWMDGECKPEEADWDNLPEDIRKAYLDQAKAAVSAVRKHDSAGEPKWNKVAHGLYSFDLPSGTLYKAEMSQCGTGVSVSLTFVPNHFSGRI